MATVYKRTQRKPLPDGAVIVDRRGARWATWVDAAGKHSARLAPDGKAVLIDRPGYKIQYFDENGRRRNEIVKIGDWDTAERIATDRETAVMNRQKGLVDPAQERLADEGRRPLGGHLADYEARFHAAGRIAGHIKETMGLLRAVLHSSQCATAADVSADAVNRFAAGLKERGLSARRIGAHLTAVKGFSRWLAAPGRPC
jgi:hypothetical protein